MRIRGVLPTSEGESMKCKYEGYGWAEGCCMGTKEIDPCPGYKKCDRFKPDYKTNADHIRALSDEELADFLCDATYKENEQGYPIMRTVNKAWWRKWLKQPCKEEP